MDHLAKRTIQLTMKEGEQPIQDKALLSQLERAIEDIEGFVSFLPNYYAFIRYNETC
jgi:hypothetical protein